MCKYKDTNLGIRKLSFGEKRGKMAVYLTDRPDSMEQIAEICGVSVSTVKRVLNRNSFIYKYLT